MPPSTRDRPAKQALSRELIVSTACSIVAAEGLDALSMRRVAMALDTGAASLYVYVSNRDELYALVFNQIMSEVPLEKADKRRWRKQMITTCTNVIEVLARYPGTAQLGFAAIPTGEGSMRISEKLLELMSLGGISPRTSSLAIDTISLYVMATAFEASLWRSRWSAAGHSGVEQAEAHMDDFIDDVRSRLRRLPPERFPYTLRFVDLLTDGDAERFEFGLNVIIDGLLASPPQ